MLATNAVKVEPLRCPGCGGLVPLGTGKTARCPYCAADVPVPSSYEALQRSAKSFNDNRALAKQLYGKIGKPPGALLWRLASATESAASVFVMAVFTAPFGPVTILLVMSLVCGYPMARIVAALTRNELDDATLNYVVLSIDYVLVTVVLGGIAIAYFREKALGAVRRDIYGSLAAELPERSGGPGRCRNCGAALDVPSGALGVPCTYCKADNLVAVPEAWVTTIRASEFRHFLAIDAALDAFRKEADNVRERLFQLGVWTVVAYPVILGLAWILNLIKFRFH